MSKNINKPADRSFRLCFLHACLVGHNLEEMQQCQQTQIYMPYGEVYRKAKQQQVNNGIMHHLTFQSKKIIILLRHKLSQCKY